MQGVVQARTGVRPSSAMLVVGKFREVTSAITVTCATDGNHGRSVAWSAQKFGCRCIIYVHASVSQGRRDAIAAYGAEVRTVAGTYDDAVRRAAEDAASNGWQVVSDTSYEGYTDIPRDVMQGYGIIMDEVLDQLPNGKSPTHVFVQGGVGGLAAWICSFRLSGFRCWIRSQPTFFRTELLGLTNADWPGRARPRWRRPSRRTAMPPGRRPPGSEASLGCGRRTPIFAALMARWTSAQPSASAGSARSFRRPSRHPSSKTGRRSLTFAPAAIPRRAISMAEAHASGASNARLPIIVE
ncbi:pyridoxal-phosphate dependent enzyme [Bradyrhizobium manausense]|uniref:pyridoxal-phosphate dependent enzyme n=1 Tax=Bradyrhizobium manausense TaxID=989370 RepID=UPI002012A7BA|nr:pyridoxal-phosphate dependent enzyme [Bradyrhizobium manausense]